MHQAKESSRLSSKDIKMIKIVQTLWRWTSNSEEYVAILALFMSLGLVSLSIVTRMTIQYESPAWEELARFSAIWMYMIGVVVVSKEGSHLKMGFIETRISSLKARLALGLLNDIVMLIVLGIFTYWATGDVVASIQRGESSVILRLGMWTVRSSFIVGCALSALHILIQFIGHASEFYGHLGGSE